jgi:hypothetical protein
MIRSGILSVLISGAVLPAIGQSIVRKQFGPVTQAKMGSIPVYTLPEIYKDRAAHPLPKAVDNSKQKFMPPWGWSIQGWSCANATATSYVYDYEVQLNRNIATSGNTPLITYEYTYHFLNSNNQAEGGDGWMFMEAFDILKATGGATSTDFGGFEWGNGAGGWMTGYDKYYNAMKNRVQEYYRIDASVASADEAIKQYLYDHADGSAVGGLMTFQINSESMPSSTVNGRRTFTNLGGGGGHALSIVGYDDDHAGGSYLTLNNWGDGLYWCPYKLLRAGGSLADKTWGTPVMFCRLKKDYSPKLTFKISLTHGTRNSIALLTGVAPSASATAPTKTMDYAGAFNYAGGAVPMVGKNMSPTIEIGLDLTDFAPLLTGNEAKFFFQVVSKGGSGTINSVTLMDYTGATVKEFPATETNKAIGTGTTTVAVAWNGKVTALRDQLAGKSGLAKRAAGAERVDALGRTAGHPGRFVMPEFAKVVK